MTRTVGKAHLIFEEMQTILCEIEMVLNSPPLLLLKADPNNLAYLSPGLFLVNTTLNGLSYVDLSNVNENKLATHRANGIFGTGGVMSIFKHEPNGWLTRELNCQLTNSCS